MLPPGVTHPAICGRLVADGALIAANDARNIHIAYIPVLPYISVITEN
jgi:hypothetical protein